MKYEGGRMKKPKPFWFLLHLSSFILPPSSFLLVVTREPKSSTSAGAPENIFDSCLRERNLARIIDRFPIAQAEQKVPQVRHIAQPAGMLGGLKLLACFFTLLLEAGVGDPS